jgi:hypothetical protein
VVVNRQYRFDENYKCGIQSNSYQNLASVCVVSLRDHDVNVQKYKCHYAIVEQPVINKKVPRRNELNFILKEPRLTTTMRIGSTFGSPRDIINVTEAMNDHGLRICSSEHDVTDLIKKELAYKDRMGTKVHCDDKNEEDNVENSEHDNGNRGEFCEIELSILKIDVYEKDVVYDKAVHD